MILTALENIVEKNWKRLMWLPVVFLVLSAAVLAANAATTGYFMKRDIDLSGGKAITFEVGGDIDINRIKSSIPYANVRLTSGLTKNLVVEIPFESDENEAIDQVSRLVSFSGYSKRIVGPALGEIFFLHAQLAVVAAFILMTIAVFVIFRSAVPSSIVVLAAATDIIGTMAVISLMDIRLSLPVLAALLTLIGYSVDTDILLTTEMTKGGRNYRENIRKAVKTGLTLTVTTLIALAAMYFVSGSFVIEQIALVLLIGLLVDIPATWLTNAGILRLWLERKMV